MSFVDIKDKIKKIFKWIFSNTLWSIITLIFPFTLLIPIARSIFDSFITKEYTIKLYIIFVLVVIIEVIIIICYIVYKKSQKKNVTEEKRKTLKDEEINYDKEDYYFKSYHKNLTVYKNGNGILINSFELVVNNINSITQFTREIDISDSKINTEFPKLKQMKKTDLNDRFKKFGFWYKCLNNDNLITSVSEHYWTENGIGVDSVAQSNPKDLKWIMEMNPSSIEVGKPYKIVYVMSIPDMFPIEHGLFSEEIANVRGTQGIFKSQFNVKHKIKNFTYTVSFENGLHLHKNPTGHVILSNKKENLHYETEDNIIFNRYIFNITNPKHSSTINIEWCFKEKRHRAKKGGDNVINKIEVERGD